MKLYRNKETGEKLYPVCNWEQNQHKMYNAHDRIWVAIYDARENGDDTAKLYEDLDRCEQAMDAFEKHIINGMVYATYKDSLLIKDYIWAYNARH